MSIPSGRLALCTVLTGAGCAGHAGHAGHAPQGHEGHTADHAAMHDHRHFDDADKWAEVFDDPDRDAWQKPHEVITALALNDSSCVADIGAGTGYFAARLAHHVPKGRVFAIDVEADMVRYLAERARKEGVENIVTPVQATADDARIPEPVDLILVVDTYHHVSDRVAYFSRLKSSLRPGGRLAIIDFTRESPMGPPVEHRIPPDEVTKELAAAGFVLAQTHTFLPNQFFLVFAPAP